MRTIIKALVAVSLTAISVGCATVQLPNNVSTVPVKSGSNYGYIDKIDFSYQPTQQKTFTQLKLCIAENVSNDAISLHDSSGSFVGQATGNYYQSSNSQTIQGGDIFKYAEETTATLIAKGTTDGGATAMGLTRDIIKFELKGVSSNNSITLVFSNIVRAQQNTGNTVNSGFSPVGVWPGSNSNQVYDSIQAIANKIKFCLN